MAPKRSRKPRNRSKSRGERAGTRAHALRYTQDAGVVSPSNGAHAGRSKKALPRPWYIYVVECADGTLYVGIATDVERRVAVHNSGRGAKYTSRRRPVRLVYTQTCRDVGSALRREREIKRWCRPKKIERLGLEGPAKLGKPRRKCA